MISLLNFNFKTKYVYTLFQTLKLNKRIDFNVILIYKYNHYFN